MNLFSATNGLLDLDFVNLLKTNFLNLFFFLTSTSPLNFSLTPFHPNTSSSDPRQITNSQNLETLKTTAQTCKNAYYKRQSS